MTDPQIPKKHITIDGLPVCCHRGIVKAYLAAIESGEEVRHPPIICSLPRDHDEEECTEMIAQYRSLLPDAEVYWNDGECPEVVRSHLSGEDEE